MITPKLRSPSAPADSPAPPSEGAVLLTMTSGETFTLLEGSDDPVLMDRLRSGILTIIREHNNPTQAVDGRTTRTVRYTVWCDGYQDGHEVTSLKDLCKFLDCSAPAIYQAKARAKSTLDNRIIPGTTTRVNAPEDVVIYKIRHFLFCPSEELELARMRAPDGHD